ncbi:ArsR/SmtB family transcription factor [Exiguobacterium profundum]|mgnify:CR=1 FL=1|uniref:ArsR/SmtB family transcription factor n=1 Tax=Exiguobacterium TaxID=33986 RepID=UPI0004DF109F|nr:MULTISPECIES: metalloregulator ArsR/SmtB family transcription factor [Exiguobacterium]QPI68025.1 winged helix-turn-helix transcriptional regulator [Exiguobacterium sp. PBE]MBG0918143.1 winged helix-turn-helix transcriptional regulator [Exiguobacterium sp. SRB7LM]MCT4799138.1 metalloregulator ArsR/SmtB family transcription factor [Exiguobacterium profundum]MCV9900434.1 metalloregulator ArsR/SmtB family transcription factor [Exiguobacterium sp. N5]MDT0192682.1 metalloregulator ArsR/SmtB famil
MEERLASLFQALADPNRLRMIELLRKQEWTVVMMANQLGISQPQTSKHLRILYDAGLVTVTIDANRRRYALKSQALEPLDAWRTYMARETERLDRLETFLAESQREENGS